MADPGVSGQNFLRLLLGGAQKGVDQIPQQQAQQADLTLALQRMMQQKQQFDESTAGIDRRFNTEQDRLKAAEAARLQHQQSVEGRQGQEAFFNTHQNWIERQNQQAFRAKLLEKYPQLAPAFGVQDAGGTASMANSLLPDTPGTQSSTALSNKRQALTIRLRDERANEGNYRLLTEKEFKALPPPLRQNAEKVKDPITSATRWKLLQPGAQTRITRIQEELDKIAGVEQHILTTIPPGAFGPEDDLTDAEDVMNDILGLIGQ